MSHPESEHRAAEKRLVVERVRLASRLALIGLRGVTLVLGSIVLMFLLAFLIQPSWFALGLANRVLANANAPSGREMPPTAYAISYTSADIQVLGGRGEGLGCSIPALAEPLFPKGSTEAGVNLQMRQACVAHDYCYRHGSATYGYVQADCDFLLQEQAFRICLFVERENKDPDPSDCRARARLVTLGVRAGGSDSFRRASALAKAPSGAWTERESFDAAASTYFEYDPYPVRSLHYVVYRLADAPGAHEQPRRKALYAFDMRPSGTVVTVTSWKGGVAEIRAVYRINGQHAFLNTPPIVLQSGSGEDWLVWWQRVDLNQTSGRFVALAPGRADQGDWNVLAQALPPTHSPADCGGVTRPGDSWPPAVAVIYVGNTADRCDDANSSEFQPAPGLAPPGEAVRLMNLRTHTCRVATNILCFTDVVLDVSGGGGRQPQEPDRANDYFNRRQNGSDGREADRYRNFVTAPVVLGGEGGPILAFFRRGDTGGKGFDDELVVRRLRVDGRGTENETGSSIGSAALEKLTEDDEPFFVLGRNTGSPALATFRLDPPLDQSLFAKDEDRSAKLLFRRWALPAAAPDKAFAEPIAAPSASAACGSLLHASWLSRPASIVAQPGGGALIVLSRLTGQDVGEAVESPLLEFRFLRLNPVGTCDDLRTAVSPVSVNDLIGLGNRPDERETRLAKLRAIPVLVDDLDGDGMLDLVIPGAGDPGRSVLRTAVLPITSN